jgi:hypothetical protein
MLRRYAEQLRRDAEQLRRDAEMLRSNILLCTLVWGRKNAPFEKTSLFCNKIDIFPNLPIIAKSWYF